MSTKLSKREVEVLLFIAKEFTTSEIGTQLYISKNTVETHRRNILNKLNVRNTAGMVRRGFELGLLNVLEFKKSKKYAKVLIWAFFLI